MSKNLARKILIITNGCIESEIKQFRLSVNRQYENIPYSLPTTWYYNYNTQIVYYEDYTIL